jgi:hypothetical protein
VAGGDFAQELKIAGIGHDEADVAAVGLEDDARDLSGIGGEGGVEGGAIVEGQHDGLAANDAGTPALSGLP